jgi:MFS family permease
MKNMSGKKYGVKVKIAVLTIAVIMYTTSITTPALGSIAKAFPNVNPDLIKQIASLPALMMILFSQLPGQLERFLSKKTILCIGIALSFVGILPAFFGDMTFILFTRVVFGAGYGIVFAYASSMIAYLFEGKERETIMGIKSSVGAAAGVVFQMLGGFLAMYNWRYAFLAFLLVIPAFLIILFWLPEPEAKTAQTAATGNRGKLSGNTWGLSIFNAYVNILQFSFMSTVAIVMIGGKIGNAAEAGMVLTIFTAGAFAAGLIYGPVTSRVFKKYTIALALAFVSASFIMMIGANTYTMFLLCGIVFGLGFGTFNPDFVMKIVASADAPASVSIGVYLAFTGVGQFLSPIVLTPVATALGFTGLRAGWYVAAIGLSAATIIAAIVITFAKTKKLPAAEKN